MPHKLVKTICQAHYQEEDENGVVLREYLGDPIPRYGAEGHAAFWEDAKKEIEALDEAAE